MSIFGHDYKGRKNQPIFHFLVRYFPKALAEVTKVCVAGNVQHNPELDPTDINWSRGKSTDQLNTALRHMIDHATSGPHDTEPLSVQKIIGGNTYHLAKAAWRILAELELQIERDAATLAGEEASSLVELVSNKPSCPICGSKLCVRPSDEIFASTPVGHSSWMCANGHTLFYFNVVKS